MPDSVYLKCNSCGALNRVPHNRLKDRPLCGKCKKSLTFPLRPVDATASTFGREAFDWPGVVIVEFWSPRCGACAMVQPVIEKLAHKKAGLVKFVKINIETEPALAARFHIRSTPTFIVYKNGKLADELAGALPDPQMESWLEAAIGS